MTLSNIDLMKLAKHYNINLNGIYMKDELNGLKPRIGNYIINLQSTNQGNGTHWTAIIFTKKRAYYFDSFGAAPPIEVDRFIKKRNERYGYNIKQIQALSSVYCGWYNLSLFHYVKNHFIIDFHETVIAYTNKFSEENRNINNSIIRDYFRKLKKHPIAVDKLHL